jgi:hypothetical protein
MGRLKMRNKFGYLGEARNDGLSFGDPGTTPTTADKCCGVCGTERMIKHNINGPTSWAGAMTGHKHLHNVFECPHYNAEWHNLAYRLIGEMMATASKRLYAMIEFDLDELVAENIKR